MSTTVGMNVTSCVIDEFGPLPIARPGSVQELGEVIRQAAADQSALYPFGGQTQLGLGMPPTRTGTAIDMGGLSQIIDFPARDMTVTVQAGIAIKTLADMLARENLRLPIDVPSAERATLGGILATNVSGPRRYGYGTLRDYVIGISALNDDGAEFKAGGRVVKNVAGYDLCKLLVGSLGTLGIITQATLKLRPRAEEQVLIGLACEAGELDALLTRLHDSRTRPISIDLLNQPMAQAVLAHAQMRPTAAPWTLLIGYEGNAEAVSWQMQQLVKELRTRSRMEVHVGFTAQPLWHALVDWASIVQAHTVFKATMLPSAAATFCQRVSQEAPCPALCAHVGNGIVQGGWPADLTKEQAARMLTSWRAQVQPGSVIVTQCPAEWKSTLSVWGSAPADAWLMHDIKAKFDPRRLFNPGRFVDGI